MDDYVRLHAQEIVDSRSFTDPAETGEDLVAIHRMASALRRAVGQPEAVPAQPRPLVLQAPEPSARQHRIVICDDRALRAARDVSFVGFFAKKRVELDPSPLTQADDELVLEFPEHPGILSYSSLELADGNWGNLILLDPPDAKEHWRTSGKHAYAAQELAPRHYTVVRLHNGVFPRGLLSGRDPVLVRTKYYDFRAAAPWRGERELGPAE